MKNKLLNKNTFLKLVGFSTLWFILYCIYYHFSSNCPINSDVAVTILRAKDILEGNIFLKDWYGSTISGLFTWAVFPTLGIVFSGFNLGGGQAAYSSIVLTCVLTLILVLNYNYRKQFMSVITSVCCCLLLIGKVCSFVVIYFGHMELFLYMLIILVLLQSMYEKTDNKKLIWFAIFMFIANTSDDMCIFTLTIPIVVVTLIRYYKKTKTDLKISLCSIIVLFLAKVFSKALSLHGIHQYNGTGDKYFCNFESISNNMSVTLLSFLRFFNADFWGGKIFSLRSCCNLIGLLFLAVSLIILCYNIKNFFKINIVDQVLVSGIVMQTAAFTFSNMCAIDANRYLIAPVLSLSILVCRFDYETYIINLKTKFANFNLKYKEIKRLLVTFFCLVPISQTPSLPMRPLAPPTYTTLTNYLIDRNLTNGFAPFWSSHVVTLASEGKVQVSNVTTDGKNIEQHRWLSKSSWYKEPANFVILNSEGPDSEYLPENIVLKVLGDPVEFVKIQNYSVLIYDYDISKRVNSDYNIYRQGSSLGCDQTLSRYEEDKLILGPGDIQFGPGSRLNKGLYRVEISGDNLDDGTFDVYSNKQDKLFDIQGLKITPNKG